MYNIYIYTYVYIYMCVYIIYIYIYVYIYIYNVYIYIYNVYLYIYICICIMPFGSSFHPTMVSHVAALLSIEGSVPQRPGISLFAPPEVDQVDLPSSKLT